VPIPQGQLQKTLAQAQSWQQVVGELEAVYRRKQRPERPHSRLAQARARLEVQQRRVPRREKAVARAQKRLERCQARLAALLAERQTLEQRLARFEEENAANPAPIRAIFRLDAGFGTHENVALLIEMGYRSLHQTLQPSGDGWVAQKGYPRDDLDTCRGECRDGGLGGHVGGKIPLSPIAGTRLVKHG
jgi:hypothetical protein